MASKPKLPTFADGTAFVEDLEQICDAIRRITPIPGGTVRPHITTGGTYFTGGSGAGGLVPVVTATTIPAATWGAGFAIVGQGTCRPYTGNGTTWTAGSAESLRNLYPETAPANRFGWADRQADGVLYLVTISCASVPAAPTLPGNTTPGTGTSTSTTTTATSGTWPGTYALNRWGWAEPDGSDLLGVSTGTTLGSRRVGLQPTAPTPP